MEIRELRAFVAVVEEGGLSAAARKLHVSQSALSQTIKSLERRLGARLLVRNHAGSRTTDAGATLLRKARGLIDHHDRVTAAMAALTTAAESQATAGLIRVGAPLELPLDLLPRALSQLAMAYPDTRAKVVHSSSATQLAALQAGELDVGLVRDRPTDPQLDIALAVREAMGVILSTARAEEIGGDAGVHLHRLAGLHWMGFARSDSPAWHDQVTATLRARASPWTSSRQTTGRSHPRSSSPASAPAEHSDSPHPVGDSHSQKGWSGTRWWTTRSCGGPGLSGRPPLGTVTSLP
ncbi:hypothetical protein GCM10010464_54810 [Pseudonocardia yunnanensis]|uniref:LysR family transcriptional regulator n=1 Tax=Pseudonocardia yunnanensis TaxID=58107 RepID=A0ABW4FB82_9PSEU